ncbi:MAG: TetR/AcrR family transcriptional regulator [Deferribacterales bacterium]
MEKKPVRERLLETAGRLFYEQGYHATGINQIIKEAETAKASFYQHFPSKEELCVAYLEERHIHSHNAQKSFISEGATPVDRVCNLFENIRRNAEIYNFNGCHFLNISAEIHEYDSGARQVVKKHKTKLIQLIEDALEGYENNKQLAETVYVIYEGTTIAVKNYRELWPVERSVEAVRALLSGAKYAG